MIEFTSERFAGNAVLEEILNDPDTGRKKLQKHSDALAVRLVQEALYDLGWGLPFPDQPADSYPPRARFVDGDYGTTTTRTVEGYKRHYRLVYPPGDPGGFVDGFAGPRTLRRLDPQIKFLDVARAEIVVKVAALRESGLDIGLVPIDGEPPPLRPWLGSGKAVSWYSVIDRDSDAPEGGEVVYALGIGAFEVHGDIYLEWIRTGGAAGPYGCPLSDVTPTATAGSTAVFEGGTISIAASGATVLEPGPVAVTTSDESSAIV